MRMFISKNGSKIMRKKSVVMLCITILIFSNVLIGCNKNKDTDEDTSMNTEQEEMSFLTEVWR